MMNKTDLLFQMMEQPHAYTEQQWQEILSDEECRELYSLMAKTQSAFDVRWEIDDATIDAEWKRLSPPASRKWLRVAAIFVAAAFLCGLSFAAYQAVASSPKTETTDEYAKEKMLAAFFVTEDCKNPIIKGRGDAIIVKWLRGTWVQDGEESFTEEHPTGSFMLHLKYYNVKLDGKELDIHNLPDRPASALKKVEIIKDGERHWQANLITTPVQAPANTKGNVNPNLTILLTGTVPKGAYQPVTIWQSKGIKDSYDWHDYIYTTWTGQWENVRIHLREVVNRKDHHVRINVCKGTPQKHLDRIENILRECNVTNYELVRQ